MKLSPEKITVVGLGVTGRALLEHFSKIGKPVVAFEEISQKNFDAAKKDYPLHGFFFKDLPDHVLNETEVFITSPGIPLTRRWAQEAVKREIPIQGELEFASQFVQGELISVTGTNGKSTTVTLIQALLENAGIQSSLKGNIGSPLISAVTESPQAYHVVEVSSYQLETIESYHSRIAVVMNVTPDHLDRYESLEDYSWAKEKIGLNQGPKDFFIYNADDGHCAKMASRSKATLLPFSLVNHFDEGGFVDRGQMVIRVGGTEARYNLNEAALLGLHNQENMLAALLAAHALGVKAGQARDTLINFKGLPHRLELVHVSGGIKFFDDSKGTNVGSVVMSLASFSKDVHLILGGRDKGGDYGPLRDMIRAKVKHLIVFGEAKEIIEQALGGIVPTNVVSDMPAVFDVIKKSVVAGDVVLLSPACSSFDQYQNYAERGDHFKVLAQQYFEIDKTS